MHIKQYVEDFKRISIPKKAALFVLLLLRIAAAWWCVTTIQKFVFPMRYHVRNIGNIAPIALCVLLLIFLVFPFLPRAVWKAFSQRRWLRLLRGVLVGVLCAVTVYGCVLFGSIKRAEENLPGDEPTTLVVLGCKLYGDVPSPMLSRRLYTAYEYLSAHPQTVCIVSGGQGDDETATEGSVMKARLVKLGIDESRIYTEENSFDTVENLRNSAEILARENLPPNIAIVTDGYHQFRAQYRARQLGLQATGLPAPTDRYLEDTYYIRELFACTQMFLFG